MTANNSIEQNLLRFITRNSDTDASFCETDDLINSGILDSLLIADLTAYIESDCGITLSVRDICPENFRTVRSLSQLIQNKRSAPGRVRRNEPNRRLSFLHRLHLWLAGSAVER